MMTLGLSMLGIVSILFLTSSNNPMKMSFTILLGSSTMFLLIKMKTGLVWMPLIFFILFTGGILMAFMILASIMPNEKMMKLKASKMFFLILVVLTATTYSKLLSMSETAPQMKSFLSTGLTLLLMVSLILIYFFGSVNLNTSKDYSMRSMSC